MWNPSAETLKAHGIRAEGEVDHGNTWSYNDDKLRVWCTQRGLEWVVATPYAEGRGSTLDEACADFVDTADQIRQQLRWLIPK